MLAKILLPRQSPLDINSIEIEDQTVVITVNSTSQKGICPHCHSHSQRVHSHYQRCPADLPVSGFFVRLLWRVRRFFCDNKKCRKTTFAERMSTVVKSYARRTNRLASQQRQVGFATNGEAGARLLNELLMPLSPDTLLRLIQKTPDTAAKTPRVLGIDDWAFRRGKSYGTILVDLETHSPIDLLPDRSAESLAKWLKSHPGVEIISRDRGKEYIKGATEGAPDAIQVADRWHLLKNLRETLQRLLESNPQCLRIAACEKPEKQSTKEKQSFCSTEHREKQKPSESTDEPRTSSSPSVTTEKLTQVEKVRLSRREKRENRYQEVCALDKQGLSIREIARRTKMNRRTVTKYIKAPQCPQYPQGVNRPSKLNPYSDEINRYLQAGCGNAKTIWNELKKLGFSGSYESVALRVKNAKKSSSISGTGEPQKQTVPLSSRRAAWLLVKPEEQMTNFDKQTIVQMKKNDETIATAHRFAHRFISMMRDRLPDALLPGLQEAAESGIEPFKHFASGIKQDIDVVTNALHLPWSQGQVEGQVNRLKLIKRQMYGRASFDLLRKRVIGNPIID